MPDAYMFSIVVFPGDGEVDIFKLQRTSNLRAKVGVLQRRKVRWESDALQSLIARRLEYQRHIARQ